MLDIQVRLSSLILSCFFFLSFGVVLGFVIYFSIEDRSFYLYISRSVNLMDVVNFIFIMVLGFYLNNRQRLYVKNDNLDVALTERCLSDIHRELDRISDVVYSKKNGDEFTESEKRSFFIFLNNISFGVNFLSDRYGCDLIKGSFMDAQDKIICESFGRKDFVFTDCYDRDVNAAINKFKHQLNNSIVGGSV